MSAAPMFTLWATAALLGDDVTPYQVLGAILMVVGVCLIGAQPRP